MSPFYYFIFLLFLVEFGVCRSYVQDKQREDGVKFLVYKGKGLSITDAPYMALYNLPLLGPVCGAAIINECFLVFAAHCVTWLFSEFAYVTVGTDKINDGDRYDVQRTFVHPKYDNETMDFDIAILKLTQSLVFSDRVQPIKLAPKNMEFKTGDMMMSMGFGETEFKHYSQQLLKVELPYVAQDVCQKIYSKIYDNETHSFVNINITDTMICAGGKRDGETCYGDSGGPLVYKDLLVGVVSFGAGCGVHPGVYARVSALRSFIDLIYS